MALLRIVVTLADAAAGASLYWMVVRSTGNRIAAVTSVIWYHLVPMTSWIMRWGNLTNAFGQPLFVASLVAVVGVPVEWARSQSVVLLTVLVGAALLTHPSTCAILMVVLGTTTILYRWLGGPGLRSAAYGVGIATLTAAVVAFVVYYAWFPRVYVREFSRIAAASTTHSAAPESSMGSRLARIPGQAGSFFGWPVLVVAGLGAWRLRREAEASGLALLLLAWAGTCALFLGIGVLTPVEMRYHFAAFPAIALMAAFGWSWAWRSHLPFRICAMLVLCAGVWVGFSGWMIMLG